MVLFLSSERLKADFANQNLADEFIRSATITSQNYLRELIGDCLYGALEARVVDEDLQGTAYQTLLDDFVVPYLEFSVMGEMCVPTSLKQGNIGVFTNYDTNANSNELNTVKYVEQYWKQRSDFYRNRLVKWLDRNADEIPEWKQCCNCSAVTPPSRDRVANTGIWLGGK